MASLKQIEANRLNAQKSTGPRSAHGKATSSQNALKTGIDAKSLVIKGENPDDLDALRAEYYERFHPRTPEQRHYLDCASARQPQPAELPDSPAQIAENKPSSLQIGFVTSPSQIGFVVPNHFSKIPANQAATVRDRGLVAPGFFPFEPRSYSDPTLACYPGTWPRTAQ